MNREINLIEEGYDLALRVGELKDSSMVARPVGSFSLSVVASPEYIKTHGRPKHPKDLTQYKCIINTLMKSPYRWPFQENGRNFSVKVNGKFDANEDFLLQSFACSNLGIAYLPSYVVREKIAEGKLISLLPDFLPKPLPISIVYPNRHLLGKAKRDLIEHLIMKSEEGIYSLGEGV